MRRPGRAALIAAAVLSTLVSPRAWSLMSPAGQEGFGQVFRSGIELVHVTVTVLDQSGRLVVGLTKEDFEILENSQPQTVTHFTGERVPVSLGLVLDVSDSMHGQRMQHARTALDRFVVDLLDPLDEVFLVTFNHTPALMAPWTVSPPRLAGRLADVKPFGGTAIYDAVLAALPLFDHRRHQRAAAVLISDGADTASDTDLRTVRLQMQRSDAFVYAIAIDAARTAPVNQRINPEALREITDHSGGYTEVVRDTDELEPATARIADELNHQYILGYTPTRPPDDQYRRIRVRVKGRELTVRARRGYIATPQRRSLR